jgi:deoxyribose-phosphate aldolase
MLRTQLQILRPDVLDNEIDRAAQTAVKSDFQALCVPPYWVKKASREAKGTDTQLLTVVGFPLGYQRTEAKQAEMELAFADGADGIELVLNLSAIKSDRINWVKAEIARFAKLTHEHEAPLTVIFELSQLTPAELEKVCHAATDAGADFLQPETGFFKNKISFFPVFQQLDKLIPSEMGLKMFVSLPEEETILLANSPNICLRLSN